MKRQIPTSRVRRKDDNVENLALLIPILLPLIGCTTWVLLRGMSVVTDSRRRSSEEQVHLLRVQLESRELRVGDLERANHHLEQLVEWQTKLLDAGPPAQRQLDRA